MNLYILLADIIAVIHFGYVLVVTLGLVIILLGGLLRWKFVRNFWLRIVHFMMIAIVVFQSLIGMKCPLTVWERGLRITGGQSNVCEEAFVVRLVHQLIFFDFPPIVFTVGYCLFAIAVLGSWWLYPPNLPWKKVSQPSTGEAS